jgi:YHS domain-containing protein
VQDVPAALRRKGLTYACYMDPTRPAIIDDTHAVRVNYETYLFADTASRELFAGDIVRFAGLLTDPVSKRRFRPSQESPLIEFEQVMYYFESDSSYQMFVRDPESYRLPGFVM